MANELYDTLIELQSLGGLTPETQPIYDELVSLGEIPVGDLGRQAAEEAGVTPERTFLDAAKDVGITAAKATIGLPEAAVGMVDLIPNVGFDEKGDFGLQFGTVGKGLEENLGFKPKEAREILDSSYSAAQKAAKTKFSEAEGVVDKTKTALMNPSVVAEAVLESAPLMLGGAVTARTIMKALPAVPGLIAAAIGEGAVATGSASEGIRQETETGLMNAKQASLAIVSGALTSAFSLAGGKIAKKLGIVDLDTLFAEGAKGSLAMKRGIAASVLGGMFSEGVLEELPQSVQEQIMQNLALNRPAFEGIEDAAVLGTLSGAAMGGGANLAVGTIKSLQKAEKKENIYKEALGFDPDDVGTPPLAGPTIADQFEQGRVDQVSEEEQAQKQAEAEALMSDIGPAFDQATVPTEEPLVMEEPVIEEEVLSEEVVEPVKKKPTKKKAKPVAKKEVVKQSVVKKEKVVVEKKVPTKKSKAGRPAMTTAEKEAKKFSLGAKTDEGFPVLDTTGEVVQTFPRKKDAQLWVDQKGSTKATEEAYKARKAQPSTTVATISLPKHKSGSNKGKEVKASLPTIRKTIKDTDFDVETVKASKIQKVGPQKTSMTVTEVEELDTKLEYATEELEDLIMFGKSLGSGPTFATTKDASGKEVPKFSEHRLARSVYTQGMTKAEADAKVQKKIDKQRKLVVDIAAKQSEGRASMEATTKTIPTQYKVTRKGTEVGLFNDPESAWKAIKDEDKKQKASIKSSPKPQAMPKVEADTIVEIPTTTKLPMVGSGHGRRYGKVWYPIEGTEDQTSSPFQMAVHKEGTKWTISWNGSKHIADVITKKYGLPLNEVGFANQKEAQTRADEILRALVKVYKGENLTDESARIKAKDLIIKKFGKQNMLVRMKANKMEYFPFTSLEKTGVAGGTTVRGEVTRKLSGLPEYRIYTMFSERLNQFVYYVQRKQNGTSDRSFPMTFTQGKPNGKVPGKSTVVNDINGVKTWLLDKIEQNGYYNALPSADDTDLKVRFNSIEFEEGAAPLKSREVPEKVQTQKQREEEAAKVPSKAEAKKTEKTEGKFAAAYAKVEEQYNAAETPSEEDQSRLDVIDGEVRELRREKDGLLEAIEEDYNFTELYQQIEDDEVTSPTREAIESVNDELENLRVEQETIKDKYSSKKQQLKVILDSSKKAFESGDLKSAYAQLGQSDTEIKVVKAFIAEEEAGTYSLDAQIKYKEKLKEAAAEQIETELEGKLGYSQVHPQWAGTAAKLKSGKVVYTSADGKSGVVQYWNGDSGELVFAFIKRSTKGKGFVYQKADKANKESHQAVKDFKKHYLSTMANVSPFAPGQNVTVSKGLSSKSKQFEGYVNSLMKLLKLDNVQIFVSYDSEVKGDKGDKNGLYGKYFQYREQSANRKDALGTLSKPADTKGKYIIQLKSGMNTTQTVRTFLHELGHIIFYEHFSRADGKTKSAVVSDWNAWKNNMKLGKVTYNGFQDAMKALESSKQHDKVTARIEATMFTEWFANRVREQVIVNEGTGGNLATQFFKKVATNLMDWAKQVMGIHNKRDAVASFLESIVESKSLTQLGIQYMKENGWTKKATQDAAIGDPVPAKPEVDVDKVVKEYVKSNHVHKPGLRRDALSMINIAPNSTEAEFDTHMEEMLFNEENYRNLPKENMPLDWAMMNQFATPMHVAKQFEYQGQHGFSKIFDIAIESKRKLHRVFASSFDRLKPLFRLKDGKDLAAIMDVTNELDQNSYRTKHLVSKFEMQMDKDLGFETIKGLNAEHYKELKQYVMTEMDGSNLTPELADMYISMRKSLDEMLMRVTKMLEKAVKKGEGGTQAEGSLRDMLTTESLGKLNNYYPHARFGTHFITGKDANGDTVERYHFNNSIFDKIKGNTRLTGRELAKKVGLDQKLTWSEPALVAEDNLNNVLDTPIPIDAMNALVNSAIDNMKQSDNVKEEAKIGLEKAFKQAVGSQMNVGKWKKNFTKRRNIAGYSKSPKEMKRVLQEYIMNTHAAIERMEVMSSFSNQLAKIDPKVHKQEWDYANNYVSTYFESLPKWVTTWKKFAFTWYLGGRASTAVLNATQNFITGVQRLNIDTNLTNPVMMKWIMSSVANLADEFGRKGIPLWGSRRLKGGFKVFNDDVHELITRIYADGDANAQLLNEMTGHAQVGPVSGKVDTVIDKLGGFMSFVERHNRVSIAITAYKLATKGQVTNAKTAARYGYKPGQKFDAEAAIQYAEDTIASAHWHYGKENLPRFFRNNPKWQSIYVFKSFPLNLTYTLREWAAHEGGKGWVGVIGALTWASIFGGLAGLPYEEELDFIWKATLGKDWKYQLRKRLEESGMDEYNDILFNGILTSMGIDLSGSIGIGFSGTQKLDPHGNPYKNALAFAEGTLGVPAAFVKDLADGTELILQKDYRKGSEKLSPKFIGAFLKAQRLRTIGLTSKKGYKVNHLTNAEPYRYDSRDGLIKTVGFSPLSETKMYRMMEVAKFKQDREKSVVDGLAVRVSNGSLTIEDAYKSLVKTNKGKDFEDFISPKLLSEGIKSRLTVSKPDALKLARKLKIAERYK